MEISPKTTLKNGCTNLETLPLKLLGTKFCPKIYFTQKDLNYQKIKIVDQYPWSMRGTVTSANSRSPRTWVQLT